jgi:TolB-like protein
MQRIRVSAIGVLALLMAAVPAHPQATVSRPVIAIMNFTNSSLMEHEIYEPFAAGLAGMLLTELRANPGIDIVERERLRQVLDELQLAQSGQVDPATAAKIGKILGAQHMIFGVFVIDRKGNLRIDVRAVNVQTSLVEHVETVSDNADNLLRAVQRLGHQLSEGLRFAPEPAGRKAPDAARKGQILANLKYARALQEEDSKNASKAVQLYREFLAESPAEYAPLQRQEVEARIRALGGGQF